MIRFVENLLREGTGPMSRPFSATRLRELRPPDRCQRHHVRRYAEATREHLGEGSTSQGQTRPLWAVGGLEDHLLIMLIYYRCYIIQEFLGFFYHVNKSAIYRAIKRVEKVALPQIGVDRKPKISRKEAEALIVDCAEQPIQGPGADAKQREYYSGKKKRHSRVEERRRVA
jgi:hypothetical protein